MSAGTPDLGTGTTFTIDNVTVHLTNISMADVTRESLESTHLGTTLARTFLASDLYDPGTINCEFLVDTTTPTTTHDVETVMADATSAWTLQVGAIGTWTGNGFVTNFSMDFPLEDVATGSFTVKCSGVLATADA